MPWAVPPIFSFQGAGEDTDTYTPDLPHHFLFGMILTDQASSFREFHARSHTHAAKHESIRDAEFPAGLSQAAKRPQFPHETIHRTLLNCGYSLINRIELSLFNCMMGTCPKIICGAFALLENIRHFALLFLFRHTAVKLNTLLKIFQIIFCG